MAIYRCNKSIKEINHRKELSPINILSIDFDWIMEPSIQAYNNFIGKDNPWDFLHNEAPGVSFKADFNKFRDICICLSHININEDDFLIANNHADIVKFIPNQPFNLYNVDHHHDCGYYTQTVDDIDHKISQQGYDCGNWVYYLAKHNFKDFKSYTWICNKNSNTPANELITQIPNYAAGIDISFIEHIKFNKVFICLSPEWIPVEYYGLFDGMIYLFDKIINK